MKYFVCILVLIFTIPSAFSSEEPLVDAFGSLPKFKSMKVSPSGNKLAYLKETQGNYAIVVQDISGAKTKPIVFAINEGQLREIVWANDERLMFYLTVPYFHKQERRWETYHRTAILNTLNGEAIWPFDGRRYLFNYYPAVFEHMLPNDPEHVLMSNTYRSNWQAPYSEGLFKLNVMNGKHELLESSYRPDGNGVGWIIDDEGEFVGYQRYNDNNDRYDTFWRSPDTDQYTTAEFNPDASNDTPAIISVQQDSALVFARDQNSVGGIYRVSKDNLQGPLEPVLAFDEFEITETSLRDLHTGAIVGASVVRDWHEQHYVFDKELASIYAALQATFENAQISILSYSKDRQLFTVEVSGGDFATDYYLYDRGQQQISSLGAAYPEIHAEMLGTSKAYTFESSDGLSIPGYLTLPKTIDSKPELLVMAHGGPFSRYNADFDWLRDFFVANGYAVYQPNFRASTGYGEDFEDAGYGQWGRLTQRDIYEGTKAVLDSGLVADKKPCIFGGSYGGYVSMLAAVEAQSLYRCAVSFAGISSVKQMLEVEKLRRWLHDKNLFEQFAQQYYKGDITNDNLASISPLEKVSESTLPLLMFHGKLDTVVRYKQSERMYARLKNLGHEQVYLISTPGGDHWFSQEKTRKIFLSDTLYFLQTR